MVVTSVMMADGLWEEEGWRCPCEDHERLLYKRPSLQILTDHRSSPWKGHTLQARYSLLCTRRMAVAVVSDDRGFELRESASSSSTISEAGHMLGAKA